MAKATEARAQQYEDALWYLLGLQEVQAVLSQKLRGGAEVSMHLIPANMASVVSSLAPMLTSVARSDSQRPPRVDSP
jgi:hypothetical protein